MNFDESRAHEGVVWLNGVDPPQDGRSLGKPFRTMQGIVSIQVQGDFLGKVGQ